MDVLLTIQEYDKAVAAGAHFESCFGCSGPQDGNEFCPCSMALLEHIVPKDREILVERWREEKRLYQLEAQKKWDEYRAKLKAETDYIYRNQGSFAAMDKIASGK